MSLKGGKTRNTVSLIESMSFDDVRLRDLHLFERVATLGSVSAAARELGVPKATASRWLQHLEARAGHRLLLRTTRTIALTPEGETLRGHARLILGHARHAKASLETRMLGGTLRLAIPVLPAQVALAGVLVQLRRYLPDVRLHVVVQNARVDLLREGFDVAVVAGDVPDSTLFSRRLARARVRIYASVSFAGQPLESIPWLATPHDAVDLPGRVPFLDQPSAIVNDREVIARTVAEGGGLALLPTAYGERAVSLGQMIPVVEAPFIPDTVVTAIHARSQREDPRLRALLDLLADSLTRAFTFESVREEAQPTVSR